MTSVVKPVQNQAVSSCIQDFILATERPWSKRNQPSYADKVLCRKFVLRILPNQDREPGGASTNFVEAKARRAMAMFLMRLAGFRRQPTQPDYKNAAAILATDNPTFEKRRCLISELVTPKLQLTVQWRDACVARSAGSRSEPAFALWPKAQCSTW